MKNALTLILLLSACPGRGEPAGAGRLKACNDGTFSLSYQLVREGNRVAARRVSVRVRNNARYFDPPTPRLREHEAMHQRINEASAKRMERELSAWTANTTDLKAAESLLRRDFREKLKAVEALNREWDANSVFVDPPASPAPAAREDQRPREDFSRHPSPSVND